MKYKNVIFDLDGTREAGVDFGFASYGFGNADNPNIVFDSFNDILEYFSRD